MKFKGGDLDVISYCSPPECDFEVSEVEPVFIETLHCNYSIIAYEKHESLNSC